MTEKSSGAMTAQEFWPIHFSTHDSRLLDKDGSCAFADALSARNTEELRKQLTDAQREIQMANDALGGNPAVHLCDRIFTLRTALEAKEKTLSNTIEACQTHLEVSKDMAHRAQKAGSELDRLRDQGVGQWEAAIDFALNDILEGETRGYISGHAKRIKTAFVGLASPPEGKP